MITLSSFHHSTSGKYAWSAPLPNSPAIAASFFGSTGGTGNNGTDLSSSGAATAAGPASTRFSSAKGIGSDQFFGLDEESADARYARQVSRRR